MEYKGPVGFDELASRLSALTRVEIIPSQLENTVQGSGRINIVDCILWLDSKPVSYFSFEGRQIVGFLRHSGELISASYDGIDSKRDDFAEKSVLSVLAFMAENPTEGYTLLKNGILMPNQNLSLAHSRGYRAGAILIHPQNFPWLTWP